ncbi:efflux RND transporter periplasmic adaptor subunit [Photobacterium lutimaris]|uniref:Efflux transporter periplasmic adaptor subunit n=1 Tax=Photobacterium lutimaris TaxID=388278 RepID=A0A2T3IZS6_9GAMM|nr:efflux RND transporter periplasmic adaptor subunit [Photobacterium lutimaris]PSU34174.1 efflux transporter periplasmic adaptor subunit [Photobacterium lutimaris]TDR75752.1 Cu(I)/Ag(I) efflux system membrane fusion protein [Photobacterium lutimaris]
MKKYVFTFLALSISAGVGFTLGKHTDNSHAHAEHSGEKQPLYWVAPMDPNYKRDQPGKSPMGMDLIPVYEEDLQGGNEPAGTVFIDPAVENNLGVKSSPAEFQSLTHPVDTVGYVSFDQQRYWQVNLRVNGWVERLYVNTTGEKVSKGDVLFTLYSPEWVKAQEELLNAVRGNRSAMVNGAKQRLNALGMDDAQVSQVMRSGKPIHHVAVKAPADGIIDALNIREGAFLSPQQTVISGGALNTVWVEAEVFERQADQVEVGSRVSMTIDALPGEQWQGYVDYIYPVLNSATRSMRVRVVFDNPDLRLKPNMYTKLVIEATSKQKSLVVPRQAVIRSRDMTRVVLALGDGKYRSARIETGKENREWIEVTAGLADSDRVVTSAQFMLDSESSQSADLNRINGVGAAPVMVDGLFVASTGQNRVRISHMPVPEWNWPAMEMDFDVSDDVSFTTFSKGEPIRFSLQKEKNQFLIVSLSDEKPQLPDDFILNDNSMMDHSAMGHDMMDHSTMDHSAMGHDMMDHSTMDHSAMGHDMMDHSTMDHSAMGHDMMDHNEDGK